MTLIAKIRRDLIAHGAGWRSNAARAFALRVYDGTGYSIDPKQIMSWFALDDGIYRMVVAVPAKLCGEPFQYLEITSARPDDVSIVPWTRVTDEHGTRWLPHMNEQHAQPEVSHAI